MFLLFLLDSAASVVACGIPLRVRTMELTNCLISDEPGDWLLPSCTTSFWYSSSLATRSDLSSAWSTCSSSGCDWASLSPSSGACRELLILVSFFPILENLRLKHPPPPPPPPALWRKFLVDKNSRGNFANFLYVDESPRNLNLPSNCFLSPRFKGGLQAAFWITHSLTPPPLPDWNCTKDKSLEWRSPWLFISCKLDPITKFCKLAISFFFYTTLPSNSYKIHTTRMKWWIGLLSHTIVSISSCVPQL